MTTVSTRKLKDGLRPPAARRGGEHVVVMRGKKAVAAIVPFEEAQGLDEDARLRQLAAQGLLVLPDVPQDSERFAGRGSRPGANPL